MMITNEIAEQIVAELQSSLDTSSDTVLDATDALVAITCKDKNKPAQIAAECLQRVLPTIDTHEYIQVATDVLRWHAFGDDLDDDDVDHVTDRYHTIMKVHKDRGFPTAADADNRLLRAVFPEE
jgi:hypothetical protein